MLYVKNPSTDGNKRLRKLRKLQPSIFSAAGCPSKVNLLKDAWLIPVQGQGTFSDPFEVDIRSLAANAARAARAARKIRKCCKNGEKERNGFK
jgi:hypothetical protein